MINSVQFERELAKGKISNCYFFCGNDEGLIKEGIDKLSDKVVKNKFPELNYMKFNGETVKSEDIINACETMPFASDMKMVVVYRANFLKDKKNNKSSSENQETNIFLKIKNYIAKMPKFTVLILYYVYENNREKASRKVMNAGGRACTVEFNKLKGLSLERKVKMLFEKRGKDIGKVELNFFCSSVDNDMNAVKNEIDKLCSYVEDKDITKEDIKNIIVPKNDNDIFNLVDSISQRRIEKALYILNELLYRGEKFTSILSMIERQFKILLIIRLNMEKRLDQDTIINYMKQSSYHLNEYICKKMIVQARSFTVRNLENILQQCMNVEEILKTTTVSSKVEMEMFIVKAMF